MPFLWMFFAALEGYREAYYYNAVDADEPQKNLHGLFTIQRSVTASVMVCCTSIFMLPVLILVFSFIHNGTYCCVRNNLNPLNYPARWKGESKTSRAVFDFTYKSRMLQFIAGVLVHLLYLCVELQDL